MSAVRPNGSAPKSMSTRLLTMKFMQRAAALPTSSAPLLINEPSKRTKKESYSITSRQNIDRLADQNAVLDALAKEEKKSLAALDRLASESGDTRWVLNLKEQDHPVSSMSLRVVQAGYANLDSLTSQNTAINDLNEESTILGRRSFGKFNKDLEKQQRSLHGESSKSDSESDEDTDLDSCESDNLDDDDSDPTSQLIKSTRREVQKADLRAKKRQARDELKNMAKKTRQTEINLNHLTSLSGRQEVNPKSKIECYSCGGPHRKIDCPRRKRGQQYIDDGPPKKSFKAS
ncbi:hypothetical protein EPUL_001069 [Erysiphe pulchra]|uniref:Uncharacterized protein n=1 Tax=Erysiphe pulchra TaxID=225359 RepID=A0A2S4Q0G5_9PEZI|nr:hypothetical protein EPUL_001069 [Erysiphe pulchra]